MNKNYNNSCSTYVKYTDDGHAQFEYVESIQKNILAILISIAIIALMLNVLFPKLIDYSKIRIENFFYASDLNNKQTWNMINDNANLLLEEDKQDLENKITEYYNRTGVQIVIETTNSEEYVKYNSDAKKLAEREFKINHYKESYLLILITNYNGENIFGLYRGNNVTKIIDTTTYMNLYKDLKNNEDLKLSLKENLINCIGILDSSFLEPDLDFLYELVNICLLVPVLPFAIIILMRIVSIIISIIRNRKLLKKGYKKVDPTIIKNNEGLYVPKLVTCKYCNGTYMFGETSCPHCNAPSTTEENGDDTSNNTKSM